MQTNQQSTQVQFLNTCSSTLLLCIRTLPFIYLGAPIIKGKSKQIHFQLIANRIKLKLSVWVASLLSIVVIQGMLVHTLSIYSLHVTLLKDLEKCIRNFTWSGDIEKERKLITIAWKKVCEIVSLKLCWELIS